MASMRGKWCGCGAPDDCYCHEDCSPGSEVGMCDECAAEWQATVDEDRAIALVMMVTGCDWHTALEALGI